MLLGTCSCAVVRCVLCALSGFAAPGDPCCLAPVCVPWLWPVACLSGVPRHPAWCAAPRPVRLLSVLRSAFSDAVVPSPIPQACAPGFTGWLRGARGGRPRTGLIVPPLAPAVAGALGSLRVVPVWGRAMGLSLAGPSGVGLGLRVLRWLACVEQVTDASGFPYRPSFDGGLRQCTRAVLCGRRHLPLRIGGRHARVPCVCSCARPSWLGRAGRPPGRILVCLTFSFGCFVFLLCLAPSGLGLPLSWSFVRPQPIPLALFFSPSCLRPRCFWLSLVSGPGCPGPWRCAFSFCLPLLGSSRLFCFSRLVGCSLVVAAPPFPFCVLRSLLLPLGPFVFFFCSSCVRPRYLSLSLVSGPGGPGPWRCVLFVLWASRCLALHALLPRLCVPPGRWLLPGGGCCPPPPLLCLAVFVAAARCSVLFFFFLRCVPPLSLAFSGFRPRVPWALALYSFFFLLPPASRLFSPVFCLPLGRWLLPGGCCPSPSLPFCVSRFSSLPLGALFVLFFTSSSCVRPRCLWLSLVSGPGCLGFSALCVVCFVGLPLLCSRCALTSFVLPAWPLAALWWLPPPPPPFFCVSQFWSLPLGAVWRVLCCVVSPWVRCCAALLRFVPHGVVLLCAVLFCCARLVPLLVVPCPLALPVALGPCALRRCVLRCSPAVCALCCVFFVVAWWCALFFAALLCAVCVLGCCAVRPLSSPLCAVLCFAVLVRLRCAVPVVRAVAGAWCCGALPCVMLLSLVCCGAVLGLVACGFLLVACFGVGVPVSPRGLLPCGWCGLLWCSTSLCVFCGAVLSRGAVLLCSAVFLRCCGCLLCPPVACCAALCCAVGWLCSFLPGGGVCVLWYSFPRAMRSLSSPLCALLCLAVLAVVPCFPVSCAVALCCRVVLCYRALLSFCGAVCAWFALLWPVVRRRAVLCCAVGCLCCFLPGGGVCVLWCPFPPCRHTQKTSIISLCYPASASVSVVHLVEESGLFVRRCCLVCRCLS